MNRQVRKLETAEAARAGAVLGRALLDEPALVAAMPEDAERSRFCPRLFTVNLRHACLHGEALAVGDGDGKIAAAAYWIRRPDPAMSARDAARIGATALTEEWGAVLARLGAIEGDAAATLASVPPPWRYLGAIGVDPERRGEGLGTALLERVLADADAAGEPVALVTGREANLPFYERAGMILAAAGTSSDGGVPFWTFRTPVSARPRS